MWLLLKYLHHGWVGLDGEAAAERERRAADLRSGALYATLESELYNAVAEEVFRLHRVLSRVDRPQAQREREMATVMLAAMDLVAPGHSVRFTYDPEHGVRGIDLGDTSEELHGRIGRLVMLIDGRGGLGC